jgi:hypothetical protein
MQTAAFSGSGTISATLTAEFMSDCLQRQRARFPAWLRRASLAEEFMQVFDETDHHHHGGTGHPDEEYAAQNMHGEIDDWMIHIHILQSGGGWR